VADLGMFSMFDRTGAPTKRGPTEDRAALNLIVTPHLLFYVHIIMLCESLTKCR